MTLRRWKHKVTWSQIETPFVAASSWFVVSHLRRGRAHIVTRTGQRPVGIGQEYNLVSKHESWIDMATTNLENDPFYVRYVRAFEYDLQADI